MREILFRAKAINRTGDERTNYKNGDWVFGWLTKPPNPYCPEKLPAEMRNTDGVSGIDIDIDTLGQSTGLKDRNGVKIFEGDVVDVDNALVSGRFWVEYGMSGAFIVKDKDDRRYFLGGCNCVVVGNVHDNPSLLGEESE